MLDFSEDYSNAILGEEENVNQNVAERYREHFILKRHFYAKLSGLSHVFSGILFM